jgi:hypothetical protein
MKQARSSDRPDFFPIPQKAISYQIDESPEIVDESHGIFLAREFARRFRIFS